MEKESGIFFVHGDGMTRIVRTRDLSKRFSEWQSANPHELSVIVKITTLRTMKKVVDWLISEHYLKPSMANMWNSHSVDQKIDYVHFLLGRAFDSHHVRGDWYSIDLMNLYGMPNDD